MPASVEALMLPGSPAAGGWRFALHVAPVGPVRGALLFLHAFAEEMNKSRRMCSMGARALADAGWAVLQIDLLGCGDSSGDFEQATWSHWCDDAESGVRWLRQHYQAPLWLWGHRAGCLLATDVMARCAPAGLLLWQPPAQGRSILQQFLRLCSAAQWQEGNSGRGVVDALKQELAAGRAIDVAGYRLSAGLASGLETAALAPPSKVALIGMCLVWLEVSSQQPARLLPASTAAIERWRSAGCTVADGAISGPAFWQTTEIEDAPELIVATVQMLAAHNVRSQRNTLAA